MPLTPMQLLHHAQFHGANRLADKTSRWYWVPSLLILLGFAITLVILTISRYLDNPIYMVRLDKVNVKQKFPNVIVCPEINLLEDKMEQFLATSKYPGSITASDIRPILPQLAAFYSPDMPYNVQDLVKIEQLLDYNGISVEAAGELLTATCEDTLIKCRWDRQMVNCSELFQMELTGDGFCCVFNGRSLRREMAERGTDIKKTKPEKHWYTQSFGYTSGLMIAVNQSQKPVTVDLSYKWIALQYSQHFVDVTVNGTALDPGTEQWIAYYTRGFQIAFGAKELSPSLRKCKMSAEELQYFPVYNKRLCLLEYEIAKTLDKCKCVRTVHPQPPGAKRCRASMLPCANHAMVAYDEISSKCPQTCDVAKDYTKDSNFYLNPTVNCVDSFYRGLDFKKVTIVRVFIQNRKRETKERWSYYGYFDLFSQLGGMFSVFFGCSMLTLLALLQLAWRVLVTQWQKLSNDNIIHN